MITANRLAHRQEKLFMCRARLMLLVFLASLLAARAQQPTPPPRPVIGIALEGGGALGIAHIGVLQWMEEHHVPIDRLSGTSMGALIGGLYASGHSPESMRKLALSDDISTVFTLQTPYTSISFRRRQDRRDLPSITTIGLKNHGGLRNALLTDGGLNQLLNREFFNDNSSSLDFDTLPIPFRCVATDLTTLDTVILRSGPLPQAVRASVSIPGVFPPVRTANGHFLADGGILDNLPTGILRTELHADVVIAVHLETGKMTATDIGSIFNVLNRAFSAGVALNENQSKKLADLVLSVPLGRYDTTSYDKAADLIKAGYDTAEANRDTLLRYALPDADWQAYLSAREERLHPAPGILRAVQVKGGSPAAQAEVQHDLHSSLNKPLTPEMLREDLGRVQADGEYSANYETFQPPANAPGGSGVLVHLRPEPGGPPFLIIGMELAASTSNVTRGLLNLQLVHQGLGGFGSELRTTARLGYLTDVSAEYYRLLTASGFFIEPQVRVLRQPVYIWANQKRIAERFQQNLETSLSVGRTLGNTTQLSAEWKASHTRWGLRTGSDGLPYFSGTAQTGVLRLTMDNAASDTISPNGTNLSLALGALYHAGESDNAPLLRANYAHMRTVGSRDLLGISANINSYLRARVADPYRFTLGGPMRLSASSFDEYRGTDTVLMRTGTLHRFASMPTGLGQGLYAILAYEAGGIWSPDRKAVIRQDGTLGLVAATPVGAITFGVSVGDAGHRKVFFTIGRWF